MKLQIPTSSHNMLTIYNPLKALAKKMALQLFLKLSKCDAMPS